MRFCRLSLVLAAWGALAASAAAIDQITLVPNGLIGGTIEHIGKYEVTIKRTTGTTEKVPVNQIDFIRIEGEPPGLNLVRSHVRGGRYESALDELAKLKLAADTKPQIKQEVDYLTALAQSRLALAGRGDVNEAGRLMFAFVQANPDSYHAIEANQILGDLLMATGKPEMAQKHYAVLEAAPWPDVKIRGAVAKGRALERAGNHAEALAQFESALKLAEGNSNERVASERLGAVVGKATCLAQTGQHAEGIKLLEEVIAAAPAEDAELHALAYNGLGNCYRKAGDAKAALLAYLHVDVLFNTLPAAHAEALANLAELWKEVGNMDRALEAQQVLEERYKKSAAR